MTSEERKVLLYSAQSFCEAFATKAPLDHVLKHFSSAHSEDILVHEHGLKQLAPFLGRDFIGMKGVKAYFKLISSCLSYENMKFSKHVIDEVERKVSVRGEAKFTWLSTAQSWDEVFAYVLAFDNDGKVVSYEIWADSGAAYLASKGLLESTN